MTRRARRNHSPAFKAKVALAAVRGEKTLAELACQSACKNDPGSASNFDPHFGDKTRAISPAELVGVVQPG